MDDEQARAEETAREGGESSEGGTGREEPAAEAGASGSAGRNGDEEGGEADRGARSSGRAGGRRGWTEALADVQEVVDDVLEGVRALPSAGRFPRYDLVSLGEEEGYRVLMDLPGVDRSDVQIRTVGEELTVSGERRRPRAPEGAETLHSERGFGRFRRTLRIPADVVREEIGAKLEDGILTIRLPREARAEAHEVEIE